MEESNCASSADIFAFIFMAFFGSIAGRQRAERAVVGWCSSGVIDAVAESNSADAGLTPVATKANSRTRIAIENYGFGCWGGGCCGVGGPNGFVGLEPPPKPPPPPRPPPTPFPGLPNEEPIPCWPPAGWPIPTLP